MIIPSKHNGYTRDGVRRVYMDNDSPPPQPTTEITESGPTIENRTSSTKLPGYINANTQDIVAKARTIGDTPYKAYTGQRVADFTPDMLTAMERMRNQGVAGEINQASGLASLAGQRASDYGMFQQGVQQYMNPYMQNVVDVERRKAQENADRQSAMLSGQAAKQGAFGGSGAALQQRALTRDTAQQLADIQTQGLGRAYEQAAGQYNTGIANMLSASGQLGGLGTTRFGQETDLIKNLGTSGDIQRQREQALRDVEYGDFTEERDYAAKQLALQKGLTSGLEYDTSTSSRSVTQPGKQVTQRITANAADPVAGGGDGGGAAKGGIVGGYAEGGMVGHYDEGGITSLLSDQQINQRQQMPNISDLARMSLQATKMKYAQMRADQQNMDAQQAMMDREPTVAADVMRQIAAARESGIAGLDVPDDLVGDEYTAAGGGIVAFQNRGEVPDPNAYGLPAISNSLIPQAAQDLMAQQRSLAQDVSGQEVLAAQENIAALRRDQAALGDFTANQEGRLQKREQGLEGADAGALQNSVLDFGLRLLSTKGKANQAAALAEAGLGTLKSHREALDKINKEKKDIDDARSRLDELRYSNKKTDLGAIRDAEKNLATAKTNGTKALGTLIGADAKTVIDAYDRQQSRSAQYAAANKPTDMRNYVRDVELAAAGGPAGQQAQIRVDAANQYIGAQKEAQLTGAATNVQKTQAALVEQAKNYALEQIGYTGPKNVRAEYSRRVKQDKENQNKTDTAGEYLKKLEQDYIKEVESRSPSSAAPAAAAPTSAAPAAAGTRPDISSVTGAPRGATIGAQTSRGWEIKDRSGKVIGYAQ
jgi:hypothetical protein